MLLRLRRRKTSTYQDPDLSGLLEEEQKRHAYSALFSSQKPRSLPSRMFSGSASPLHDYLE